MVDKGNVKDFMSIVKWDEVTEQSVVYYQDRSDDMVFTKRFRLDDFIHNYDHAIVSYYRACGCKHVSWNHNAFGGFYVYFTKPTKAIDPEVWFEEQYKPGMLISRSMKFGLGLLLIMLILMILVVLKAKGYI